MLGSLELIPCSGFVPIDLGWTLPAHFIKTDQDGFTYTTHKLLFFPSWDCRELNLDMKHFDGPEAEFKAEKWENKKTQRL